MNNNVSLLISTCNKFSDLWDLHIEFLKKNWVGELWKVYMVTDCPTDKQYENVEIIVADGGLDFPARIKYALDFIDTDYVLLTLDDYFLIEKTYAEKLDYLAERAKKEQIDYLLLYDRRYLNPKKYEDIESLRSIDLNERYSVNLYPAIWNKSFLKNSVKEDLSPWQYEPTLTKYAKEANGNCMFSHNGVFDILDVIRKGKLLHKAKRYLKKNGFELPERPTVSYFTEIKLEVMAQISWHAPKWLFHLLKKTAKAFGMKFYNED